MAALMLTIDTCFTKIMFFPEKLTHFRPSCLAACFHLFILMKIRVGVIRNWDDCIIVVGFCYVLKVMRDVPPIFGV
jgi:hypothetical protein